MPPAGILQFEMDPDQLLEIELQQELDAINLDNDNFEADEDQDVEEFDLEHYQAILEKGDQQLQAGSEEQVRFCQIWLNATKSVLITYIDGSLSLYIF